MSNKKYAFFALVFSICVLLAGCEKESPNSRWSMLKKVDPEPVVIYTEPEASQKELVQGIKDETNTIPSIYDVAVIKGKKDTLVAYKVKQMARFKMKSIEKELTEMLESKYPEEKFTVSSDFKIFLETMRLRDKIQEPDFSKEKADKRLKEIIELNNELT
ncbi:YhcN/YlaJ family sporulation lipoprotein [Niallia sp.]|uniref:YhcN/YlaJ family sporulation lipoprotein n=1 Tax=Niallia sp. TaxID=2837523 RepID=UPI0028A0A9A2|nr:YhcN/YlaJ family sporulation lipoprotein [Niallia sp.]